jgi:hypothetical protein
MPSDERLGGWSTILDPEEERLQDEAATDPRLEYIPEDARTVMDRLPPDAVLRAMRELDGEAALTPHVLERAKKGPSPSPNRTEEARALLGPSGGGARRLRLPVPGEPKEDA